MTIEARRGLIGATLAISGQAANLAVLAAAALVLPRLLGPVDYGHLSAILAVVAVLMVFSTFGLPVVEARFLAPLSANGDARRLGDLASSFWTLRLAGSALAGLAVAVWLLLSASVTSEQLAFAVAVFATWRYAAQATRSLLLALGRVRTFVILEVLQTSFFLVAFACGYLAGGLLAGFAAAAGGEAVLFLVARRRVLHRSALSVRRFRFATLAPHLDYGAWSFVGSLAAAIRVFVPVWAVAAWSGPRQAAYFGLAVQAFGLLLVILVSARQTLLPILAELEARGDTERVWIWIGWLMRVSAAAFTTVAIGWALIGRDVLVALLGAEFAPAFWPIVWTVGAAIATAGGVAANTLLFLRQKARAAAINLVVVAGVTLAGLVVALAAAPDRAALRVGAVYLVTGCAFLLTANASVRRLEGRWLPLGRFALLALPAALAWPAATWSAPLGLRLAAAVALVGLYAAVVFGIGLIRPAELRYLRRVLMARAGPTERASGAR